MIFIKTINADTHEKIALKVEKWLQAMSLSMSDCDIQYSPVPITFFGIYFGVDHYAMISYEKEEEHGEDTNV